MKCLHPWRCLLGILLLGWAPFAAAEERLTFEQHVRPIFKAYCLDCHGAEEERSGSLDLRLKRFAERGGDSGPAMVVGKPAESLLLERLKAGEMPPGEVKVPADQIALIERWIASGAATVREEPESLPPGIDITPEDRAFWAFQPLVRPAVPPAEPADRVRTPIDAFVVAKLKEHGLGFAPDADKRTLIRRAAFDLTGLPPTPEEIDRYLADDSAQAYEAMIERLLASPHYGERWARHWLDVAGYADSDGDGTKDTLRPYAYKYRDYVIRAFNRDKPLDQFIIEQLAGDELVPLPWTNLSPEQVETLAATGFLRTAADSTGAGGNLAEASNQVVADTLKIVGSSLLGMTVGCAQCHDHRYDPIPQSDYFRLRAVFEPALSPQHWRRPAQRLLSLYTDEERAQAAAIEAEVQVMQQQVNEKTQRYIKEALERELEKFPEEQREMLRAAAETPANKRTDEQKQLLASNPRLNITAGVLYQYDQAKADEIKADNEKIAARRAQKPVEDFVSILNEIPGQLPKTHLFHRGDYRQPKQAVAPGDLTIAAPEGARLEIAEDDPSLPTSGRRLAYARHLTSGKHPLVGRVLANRIWLHHFGRGIVTTPGDFGALGTRPTHPELLDYLATELAERGWSLKEMHRLIMHSTVYRQSSQRREAHDAVDSDNALYGRYPLRRLDAESLRDHILAVGGTLDRTPFGPPIPVSEDAVGQIVTPSDAPRRSIYLQVQRTRPVSFLTAFDAPVVMLNCESRQSTTSAPQSLMLMNSPFILEASRQVAERVRRETPSDYAADVTAPLAGKFVRPADAWQYGYGRYDEATQRVASFTSLPHFTGSAWQGGATLPDESTGWVLLTSVGGHAGNDADHAAIRRWVVPAAGKLTINGQLKHATTCGDGVRGRIVSSRVGLVGTWEVNQSTAATAGTIEVEAGDTIDMVVDCRENPNCDSFEWAVELHLTGAEGQKLVASKSTESFRGPSGAPWPQLVAYAWQLVYQRPATAEEVELGASFLSQQMAALTAQEAKGDPELTALTSLCQQLLSSNEFLYVD